MITRRVLFLVVILFALILGCDTPPPVGVKSGTGGGLTHTDHTAGTESGLYVLGRVDSDAPCMRGVIAVSRNGRPDSCEATVNGLKLRQVDWYADTSFAYYVSCFLDYAKDYRLVISMERGEYIYGNVAGPAEISIRTPSYDQIHYVETDLEVEWEPRSEIEHSEVMVYGPGPVLTYSSGELISLARHYQEEVSGIILTVQEAVLPGSPVCTAE
jgi:hypothetical protein